jgi:transcriptional regulator with XRE-family HTH domain
MDLGGTIQEAREAQGLMVSELARRAGLTTAGVMYIEEHATGRTRLESVVKIARALGIGLEELVEKAEARDPSDPPKVIALPSLQLTNLHPEQLDERLRETTSATTARRLLDTLEAEERDLEEFYPRHVAPQLERTRLYKATALDRWLKLADDKRDPASNRFKGVVEIAAEIGVTQKSLRDEANATPAKLPGEARGRAS